MKRALCVAAAMAMIIALVVFTIFGQRGVLHLRKLEIQLQNIENDNIKFKHENVKIRNDIELLKKNVQFIEDIARKELGLAKHNELVYHLDDTHGRSPDPN